MADAQLTDDEREALGRGLRDHDPEPYYPDDHSEGRYYAMYAVALTGVIERIVAARLAQQREAIATAIEDRIDGTWLEINAGPDPASIAYATAARIVREHGTTARCTCVGIDEKPGCDHRG